MSLERVGAGKEEGNVTRTGQGGEIGHISIYIDQTLYQSPKVTTGEALHRLGKVGQNLVLYQEGTGDMEDTLVENSIEIVTLNDGDHLHSSEKKIYTIYVNGQAKTVTTKWVTYKQIVAIAFPNPPTGSNILITVGYEDGPAPNPEGSLMPGGKVKVQNGMIFNVTPTDKS